MICVGRPWTIDQLDPILKMYFEDKATPEEITAAGNDGKLVYEILNSVESPANEFKRRQLPPTLIISRNAIGIGRRRPITHHYKRTASSEQQTADSERQTASSEAEQ